MFADGACLWAEVAVEQHNREAILLLRAALERGVAAGPRADPDPFLRKALAAEGLIWSVVVYGLPGFLELAWQPTTVHLDRWELIRTGLLASVGVFAVLFGAVVVLFRGSSRGHRILVESFVVLLIGAPFSAVQAVSDINLHLDSAPAEIVNARVEGKAVQTRRRRSRHSSPHYYLQLAPSGSPGGDAVLPARLQVDVSTFHAVPEGGEITARVRPGRFGFRWIESVRPRTPG